MLVPFGLIMPVLVPYLKKTLPFIICLLVFNIAIEVAQYIFRLGSFDVDDLILNSSGALIAYAIIKFILSLKFIKRIELV